MNNQVKVNSTQKHSDIQGEHTVHKGKLVLVWGDCRDENYAKYGLQSHDNTEYAKPLIVSETELSDVGDWVYDKTHKNPIGKVKKIWNDHLYFEDDRLSLHIKHAIKVLALPEHFSDAHLQAIVDGKLNDGDEVLVKCEKEVVGHELETSIEKRFPIVEKIIHLNQQNHITLFPAERSIEEVAHKKAIEEFKDATGFVKPYGTSGFIRGFKAGAAWAVETNYKGE